VSVGERQEGGVQQRRGSRELGVFQRYLLMNKDLLLGHMCANEMAYLFE
jgi:hypothetical protein